jgi:hypothetical protein
MDLGKAKVFEHSVRGEDWWADVIAVSDLEDGRMAIDAVLGEQVRAEIALRLNAHEGLVAILACLSSRTCRSDCQNTYMDPLEDPRNPRPNHRCASCMSRDVLAQLEGK